MDEEMKELIQPPHYYRPKRGKIVRVSKYHPYYQTSNKGNISESRLVMAEHLGRNLTKDDIVYYKDGNQEDSSIGNLIVLTRREFATIRDLKRLREQRARIDSKISLYENYLVEGNIDPISLSRGERHGRYWEVDRDREAYDRSRRGMSVPEDFESEK